MNSNTVADMALYRIRKGNQQLIQSVLDSYRHSLPDHAMGTVESILLSYYLPQGESQWSGSAALVLPIIVFEEDSFGIHFHDCSPFFNLIPGQQLNHVKIDLSPDIVSKGLLLGKIHFGKEEQEQLRSVQDPNELGQLFMMQVMKWHASRKLERVSHPFLGFRTLIENILDSSSEDDEQWVYAHSESEWTYGMVGENTVLVTLYPHALSDYIHSFNKLLPH